MGLFNKGSSTTSTTSGSQPWGPTIPGLKMGVNAANQAFQSGVGSQPYTGSMVVPFSSYTTNAFTNMNNLANKFQPGLTQAGMNVNALANEGGLNRLQDLSASQLAPIAAQNVAEGTGQFNDVQRQAYGYLNPIAAGQSMQGNPYLDEVIRRSSADITGAQNMAASAAGRYGSGGFQAATQEAISDMAAPLRFADYNTQQGRMDAAIRDVFGMGTQANTQTEADWARKMAAIGGQADLGQQQWQNITALPGQMAAGYQAALAPSQTQQMIGGQYEDLMRRNLNDQERIFREGQAAPWQNINNLNAALGGGQALANYGTRYGSATQPTPSMASQIAGGALAGGSMFNGNPWGIAAGAAYGGLGAV